MSPNLHIHGGLAAIVGGAVVVAATLLPMSAPTAHAAAADPLDVVPRVQSWTAGSGSFALHQSGRIVIPAGEATDVSVISPRPALVVDRSVQHVADSFATDLAEVGGVTLAVTVGATPVPGDIVLDLATDTGLGDSGYRVTTADTVTVEAQTSSGLFNATRTLLQLLRLNTGADEFARGVIVDQPSLSYRAISVDVGRRYWEIDTLKALIRDMSWQKLNVLQLHFNESEAVRLYSEAYAGIAPSSPSERYSQAQIDDLERFANDHNVTLVPEIDLPAHATAVALGTGTDRSLRSQCGSQYNWVLDYTDAGKRQWAVDLIGEFAAWFDGPYFHIGNDEVPHELASCDYVEAAIASDPAIDTFEQLQERFANQQADALAENGKRAMMWANGSNVLPDTDIILVNFGSLANADNLRSLGYDVVNTAYNTGSYTRFFLIPAMFGDSRHVAKGNIYSWTPATPGGHNLGQQLAVWADELFYGEDRYFMDELAPRRSELAERTWNSTPTLDILAQFRERVAAIGDAPGTIAPSNARTDDGQPSHRYDFDAAFTPSSDTHYAAAMTHPGVTDSIGELHGTAYTGSAPTRDVAGVDGAAIRFTAAANRRFSLGGADVAPPWTAAMWVNRETASTDTQLLRSWNGAIKAEQHNTGARLGITKFGVGDYSFDYTLPLNEWVHIALVADSQGTRLYVDGQQVGQIAQTIALPQGALGGNRSFGGRLDDVLLYDEALSSSAVATLHDGYGTGATDLAQGRPVTASSQETAAFPASNAVDGNATTRWSSLRSDPQWIAVDLGAQTQLSSVRLEWEAAYGRDYQVQVSGDGTTWTTAETVTGGNGGVDTVSLNVVGRHLRILGTARGTNYGYSLFSLSAYGSPANLAHGKSASASSQETAAFPASNAVDGNATTRWSSLRSDPQWIAVDLGVPRQLSSVRLEWEGAYARDYQVQVSDDGTTWSTAASVIGGDGGVDVVAVNATGRHVRVLGTARGTSYGYSLWEISVG
ncbi:discoidin domain-containing protein [Agromyces badenianii]|uniref:discoidin domain-containing protein n=1 Tax=Agromyces badenianii TaxID=2080742 RepID=UPI001059E85F|nr:discoidin domain-containing protein [Agromyces badenianii]